MIQPNAFNPLILKSDISILRYVESVISEGTNRGHGLQEHRPGPAEERIVAWQTEMWERLGASDVRNFWPTIPTVLNYPGGTRGGAMPEGAAKLNSMRNGSPTRGHQDLFHLTCVVI